MSKQLKISQDVFNLLHPIGSVYISTTYTNPKTLFSAFGVASEWTQVNGYYLYAGNSDKGKSDYTGHNTQEHTLTVDQIPKHRHGNKVTLNMTQGAGNERAIVVGGGSVWNAADTYQNQFIGGGKAHSHNVAYFDVYCWYKIKINYIYEKITYSRTY